MANTKRFHRHFETPGLPLYWIIIAYIILGWFFPVIGLLAIICMIGPVVTSIFKGRWWCGHVCPRGNMYDRASLKVAGGADMCVLVATCTTAYCQSTHPIVRFQGLCVPSVSACLWCSSSSACSASS